MGGLRGVKRAFDAEGRYRVRDVFEQPFTAAENDRRQRDLELVDNTGRQRLLNWVQGAVSAEAEPVARLMERQTGPYCVRDKILLQTEPGLWLPMYAIYPKRNGGASRLPALLFSNGSGPGNVGRAGDEDSAVYADAALDGLPSPYLLSQRLKSRNIVQIFAFIVAGLYSAAIYHYRRAVQPAHSHH